MAARTHHHHLIEWLESTSHWLAHRSADIGVTRTQMTRSLDQMTFRAPAGDRVRRSGMLMEKNFVSIEHELDFMARVCQREATRLSAVDRRVTELYQRLEVHPSLQAASVGVVVDPSALAEVGRYEQDPVGWMDRAIPPEPVDETPLVTAVDPDEPAATDTTTLRWTSEGGVARCRPAAGLQPIFTVQPWPLPGRPLLGRMVMDLESIRSTAQQLARCATGVQDHQAAITRRLSALPPDLRQRLRRRLERTRRACSLGLERAARRLSRQASLLRTRAATPGLVDGAFRPDLPPFGHLPTEWQPTPQTKEYQRPLVEQTDRYLRIVTALDRRMTLLVRRLPVITGELPAGWWKPIGLTKSIPPKPVWGSNIPPHLMAVVALLGASTGAAVTPRPIGPVAEGEPLSPGREPTDPEDDELEGDPDGPEDEPGDDLPGDDSGDDPGEDGSGDDTADDTTDDTTEETADDGIAEPPPAPAPHRGGGSFSLPPSPIAMPAASEPVATPEISTGTVHVDDVRDAVPYRRPSDRSGTADDGSVGTAPIAAGGAAVAAGTTGGLIVANRKARARIVDWAGYVQRKGVLAKKGGTTP